MLAVVVGVDVAVVAVEVVVAVVAVGVDVAVVAVGVDVDVVAQLGLLSLERLNVDCLFQAMTEEENSQPSSPDFKSHKWQSRRAKRSNR